MAPAMPISQKKTTLVVSFARRSRQTLRTLAYTSTCVLYQVSYSADCVTGHGAAGLDCGVGGVVDFVYDPVFGPLEYHGCCC